MPIETFGARVNPVTLLRVPITSVHQNLFSQAVAIAKGWLGEHGSIMFESTKCIVMESPITGTSAVQHTKIEHLASHHPDVFSDLLSDEERSALCLVTIGISAPGGDKNKSHHHLRPQRLMVDLAEGLPNARVIDGVLSNEANVISFDDSGPWTKEYLSQSRPFPSVIIGMNERGNRPILDPDTVASYLTGLAEVRYVESPATIEVICSHAGIQNFARDSILLLGIDQKTPRLALNKDHLRTIFDRTGRKPSFELFQRLALRTRARYPVKSNEWHQSAKQDPISDDSNAETIIALRNEIEYLESELDDAQQDVSTLAQQLNESQILIDATNEIRDKYKKDLKEANKKIKHYEKEFNSVKQIFKENGIQNIEQFAQLFEDVDEPDQDQEYQPANVEEVLKRVRTDFQHSITVLESAMKSAEQHAKFRFPYRVWEVFTTLNELHERAVQMNRQRNQRVNLEALFQGVSGLSFAIRESGATMERHGDTRKFRHKGRWREMQPHLKIGSGNDDSTLRIHFIFDRDEERFLIGHCGQHLPLA